MEKVDLLLINPPFHQRSGSGSMFPLGLGYIISTVQNNGYSWKVIDCTKVISTYFENDLKKLEDFLLLELIKYCPEVIGIGPCITTQVKALKIIADCCIRCFSKERIFAGGPLASIDNQEWFFFEYLRIDNIIKGDGEIAIINALKSVKSGKGLSACRNITTRQRIYYNEIRDIDNIPFPYRPFLRDNIFSIRRSSGMADVLTASMITSRGCLYNCKYCVSGNMKYKQFRKRSYNSIAEEMLSLNKRLGVSDIIFYDDCFFYNNRTINEDVFKFCAVLKEKRVNVTWQMEIRPDALVHLSDQSVVLLKQNGCRQINIGIEKTSDIGLNYLGKRISLDGISEAIQRIKRLTSITIAGTFILGGSDETEDDIKKTIDDSTKMALDFAHYNPLFIYPGTPLYETFFINEYEWVDYILNDTLPWGEIVYENKNVTKEKLLQLVDYAYSEFYANTNYAKTSMVDDRFNLKGEESENI